MTSIRKTMKVFKHNKFAALINEFSNNLYLTAFFAKAQAEFDGCDVLDAYYTKTLIDLGFPKAFASMEHDGTMLISKNDISNAFNGSARYVGKLATGETVNEPVFLNCEEKGTREFRVTIGMEYNGEQYVMPTLADKICMLYAMYQVVFNGLKGDYLKFTANDQYPQDKESVEA